MFFTDDLQIEIIDVFLIDRKSSKYTTPKRPFHILTKRIAGCCDMAFGNDVYKANESNLLYIPANTEYRRTSYDDETIVAIHFNIANRSFQSPLLIDVDKEKCDNAFLQIFYTWSEKKIGYRYKCAAILYDYLSSIIIQEPHSKEYRALEKSIEYIDSNPSEAIQINTLARMCNLCETQYRKLFKKEFGVSPVKYINSIRINHARSKLTSGYYSMSEIAEECGFASQKYFNKVFKEETGQSPSEYKKSIG